MRILEQLALHHNKWLKMAISICNDPILAEDIVGDMYVKLGEYEKELNDAYVYYALKHIFIDYVRENDKKTQYTEYLKHSAYTLHDFEQSDEQNKTIELPDCLTWVEKQILLLRQTRSGRDIERQYHINYQKVHRIEKQAKEKLKQWAKKYEAQAM